MRRIILPVLAVIALLFMLVIGAPYAGASALQESGTPFDGYIVKIRQDFVYKSVLSTFSLFTGADPDLTPVPYSSDLFLTDDWETIERLIASGIVEYVEPNYILEPLDDSPLVPNDPRFPDQWTLDVIKYLSLYNDGYDGENVTVAVIDSGLYAWYDENGTYHGHEEFRNLKISEYSRNFLGTGTEEERAPYYYREQRDIGHGTFVSSQIAAATNNGLGIAGIADKVELMVLRCISQAGGSREFPYDPRYDENSGSVAIVASAIKYAADHGADVINLSLGGAIDSDRVLTLQDAVNYAHEKGVIIVAAAGNNGTSTLYYPAACYNVIGVGSVSKNGSDIVRSSFSQRNVSVDVTAPGDMVLGVCVYPSRDGTVYTSIDESFIYSKGTSYSAPVVSALAAIVKSINPELDHDDFLSILAVTSRDLGTPGWDADHGYGVLDAEKILEALTQDEYRIEYVLCDSAEEPASLPEDCVRSYRLNRKEELELLVPTREGYTFEGWYETSDYSTEPLWFLPLGAFGYAQGRESDGKVTYEITNLKLYARWSKNPYLGIRSITVLEKYEAKLLPESANEYAVTLPKSSIGGLAELKNTDIAISAYGPGDYSIEKLTGEGSEEGTRWKIELSSGSSSAVYYLNVRHSAYDIPAVTEGADFQRGQALLPSLDGLKEAVPYTAEISQWFTPDADDYTIVSSDGKGEARIESVISGDGEGALKTYLKYLPVSEAGSDYKDQVVTIKIKGRNEDFESEGVVTVEIAIGRCESNSVVIDPVPDPDNPPSYDLYTHSAGFSVRIDLFDNVITGIFYRKSPDLEISLGAGDYSAFYVGDEDHVVYSVTVTLSHDFLFTLPPGVNEFVFRFSAGEPAVVELEIIDSAPRYKVEFFLDESDEEPYYTVLDIRESSALSHLPGEPVKEGYRFVGWYLPGTETRITADTVVESSLQVVARWVRIEDGGGGGGFFPIPFPVIPVEETTEPGPAVSVAGGSSNVTIKATVSDNVVSLEEPSDEVLEELISGTLQTGRPLIIKLGAVGEKPETVLVPSGMLSRLAESGVKGLNIVMPDGKGAVFDSTALETLASAAFGDLRLTVRDMAPDQLTPEQRSLVGNAPVISLEVRVGDKKVHDFGGGKATISIPAGDKPLAHPVIWRMTVDSEGNVSLEAIECRYNSETKCYKFKTGTFSEYVLADYPFADTPDSAWYYEDVVYAYVNGLFSGTSGVTFSPGRAITRGMLVTVLWRMEGSPAVSTRAGFSDVLPDAYYAEAVAWASASGIVSGFSGGRFGPDINISREQLAAILYRYAAYKGYDVSVGEDTNILSYKDAFEISEYAVPAIQWACGVRLLQGSGGGLYPHGEATRAQVAAILRRFSTNVAD